MNRKENNQKIKEQKVVKKHVAISGFGHLGLGAKPSTSHCLLLWEQNSPAHPDSAQAGVQTDGGNSISAFILSGVRGPLLGFMRCLFFFPRKLISSIPQSAFLKIHILAKREGNSIDHQYQEKALSSCSVYLRPELHQCKHIITYLNMQSVINFPGNTLAPADFLEVLFFLQGACWEAQGFFSTWGPTTANVCLKAKMGWVDETSMVCLNKTNDLQRL